jgi:hypothetical protein
LVWEKAKRFRPKWTGEESSILAALIFTFSRWASGLIWSGMGSKFLEQCQMAVSDLHGNAMAQKVKF